MAYYPQSAAGLNYITYPVGPAATPTNVATSASANTKGTYVQYIASSPFLTNRLIVAVTNAQDGNSGYSFLIDLATGAGGAEVVKLPDMMVSQGNGQNTASTFPVNLAIPASTRIALRSQATLGSKGASTAITLIAAGGVVGIGSYLNYGSATGDSGGQQVDPGGTIDTKGAYAQITASTSAIIQHLLFMTGVGSNALPVTAIWSFDFATGAGGAEVILIPDIRVAALSSGTNIGNVRHDALEYLTFIAASTRLAVRASCSINDATDRLVDVALLAATAPAESGGESSSVFG